MGKAKGVNQKAAAAAEKKAQHQDQVNAKKAAEHEREQQAEWSKGANLRGAKRAEDAATKADDAARKRREKAELLAEEEKQLGAGGKGAKKTPTLSKKSKNKKMDDLSMLEDALVGAADKKAKAKRQAERQKAEESKRQEQARIEKEKEKPLDPLLENTEAMIQGTTDELVGRAANILAGMDGPTSGIDAALGSLNVGDATPGANPSRKALFKAFEERKMAELKEEFPNLKLSQYKDKVFQLWKKSAENPDNQSM